MARFSLPVAEGRVAGAGEQPRIRRDEGQVEDARGGVEEAVSGILVGAIAETRQ